MYITFESFPWTNQYWVVSVMCLAQWKKNRSFWWDSNSGLTDNYLLQVHTCTYFSMYNTWKSMTAITNRLLNNCFVVKSHWSIGRVGLVIVLNYMLIPFACLEKLMPFCIFENLNMCCCQSIGITSSLSSSFIVYSYLYERVCTSIPITSMFIVHCVVWVGV